MAQIVRLEKVSQDFSVPLRMPVRNQRVRCSDDPWVKESGTA
jgi:hypothetical protein